MLDELADDCAAEGVHEMMLVTCPNVVVNK